MFPYAPESRVKSLVSSRLLYIFVTGLLGSLLMISGRTLRDAILPPGSSRPGLKLRSPRIGRQMLTLITREVLTIVCISVLLPLGIRGTYKVR